METNHEYRSEALGAIHETMTALEAIGAISKVTMSEFDAACLQPVQELAAGGDPCPARTGASLAGCVCHLSEYLQEPGFGLGTR